MAHEEGSVQSTVIFSKGKHSDYKVVVPRLKIKGRVDIVTSNKTNDFGEPRIFNKPCTPGSIAQEDFNLVLIDFSVEDLNLLFAR